MSETVADIVREMRERCVDKNHSPNLWEYIDRIEAASNREVADALDVGAFLGACEAKGVCNGNS